MIIVENNNSNKTQQRHFEIAQASKRVRWSFRIHYALATNN